MSDALMIPALTYLGQPIEPNKTSEPATERQRLERAAKEFEALFVREMLKSMRSTVEDSSLGGGSAGRTYQSMFDDQLAGTIAEQGGLGLTSYILEKLSEQLPQEEETGQKPSDDGESPK